MARVVKARADFGAQLHLATDGDHPADQATPRLVVLRADRHEVVDLHHAILGEKSGYQDVGVREVELMGCRDAARRRHAPISALLDIQQRSKYARRVKAW